MKEKELKTILATAALIIITFLAFWPSLFNNFINLDDNLLIINNPLIAGLDGQHLFKIFTTMVQQHYVPLTMVSFAIEHCFFNINPFIYHLDNLLLHIGTCVLILWLCRRMPFSLRASFFAGLLFAIHPIHVESVDWLGERKDVLYSFFYLLALHQYLTYCQNSRTWAYILSLGFGCLSMLSKPMALSLPIILFLMDWLQGRKLSRSTVLEKVPFLLFIVPLTALTFMFHIHVPFNARLGPLIWIWSFTFYLRKFLFPVNLMIVYFLPKPVNFFNPEYVLAAGIFLFFIFSLFYWRRNRWWLFGCGFYFFSIFYLLRFNITGDVPFVGDHYMYLSSLGFCMFIGLQMDRILTAVKKINPIWGKLASGFVLLIFLALGAKTLTQHNHWKDEGSLVTYLYSQSDIYNMEIGDYYFRHGQYPAAIKYYEKSLGQNPNHDDLIYNTMGVISSNMGKLDEAIMYYNRSINSNPKNPEVYLNLAALYDGLGKYDLAFDGYTKAIQYNPYFAQAYHNRAIIYCRRGN